MALLLSRFFRNSAEFWMGLQSHYNLERKQERLTSRLERVTAYGARAIACEAVGADAPQAL